MSIDIRLGDCRDLMPTLADNSVDAIITDPPYPCIKRPYGMLTEDEWWSLMMDVCKESRRVLKPAGSAVFVLQPNSRKVGSMRGWPWRFMAWACDEWNMVQDAWWWNIAAIPEAHAIQGRLMRPSIKACVWLGDPDCYRDQESVLWQESDGNRAARLAGRADRAIQPSGHQNDNSRSRIAAAKRGGVCPFNVFPSSNGEHRDGHPAATPPLLADFWVRYISPPDGVVLDPFLGSGTVGLAAYRRHRSFVGFESIPEYVEMARRRLAAETDRYALFGAMDDEPIGVAAS